MLCRNVCFNAWRLKHHTTTIEKCQEPRLMLKIAPSWLWAQPSERREKKEESHKKTSPIVLRSNGRT